MNKNNFIKTITDNIIIDLVERAKKPSANIELLLKEAFNSGLNICKELERRKETIQRKIQIWLVFITIMIFGFTLFYYLLGTIISREEIIRIRVEETVREMKFNCIKEITTKLIYTK